MLLIESAFTQKYKFAKTQNCIMKWQKDATESKNHIVLMFLVYFFEKHVFVNGNNSVCICFGGYNTVVGHRNKLFKDQRKLIEYAKTIQVTIYVLASLWQSMKTVVEVSQSKTVYIQQRPR